MSVGRSGVEDAELHRIAMFKRAKAPAKLIFRDFSLTAHHDVLNAGLTDDDFINMFDFFQEAEHVSEKNVRYLDLDFPSDYQLGEAKDNVLPFSKEDQHMFDVTLYPGTEKVESIAFFDIYGNNLRTDWYDWRGFRSFVQYFSRVGEITSEFMYTPSGKRVYESYYAKNSDGQRVNSLLKLDDFQGKDYVFRDLDHLLAFFLDQVNLREGGKNSFLSDRRMVGDYALALMKTDAYKYVYLHNTHSSDKHDQVHGVMTDGYRIALEQYPDKLDGIIVQSQRQKSDLEQRLTTSTPIMVLPSGTIPDELWNEPRIPIKERNADQVISISRRAVEKQIDHMVSAFDIVHKQIPAIQLHVYGYGDPRIVQQIDQQVKELNLGNVVHFDNYVPDLTGILNHARLSVLTSIYEGLAIGVIESLAHGIPVVTYDTNYGPGESVEDGVDGYVVPVGDIEGFANKVVKLMTNPSLLQQFSTAAYERSKRFSESNVWKSWTHEMPQLG